MGPVAETLRLLLGTIALMALLGTAYGIVARGSRRPGLFPWAMGGLFGAAALLAMLDPLHVAPGVIADLRGLPLALAGAFVGWRGAAVAASMALALRLGIGGPGVVAGCAVVGINALAGVAWARLVPEGGRRGPRGLAGLAALSSLHLGATALLPAPHAWQVATQALPILLPLHVAGILVVGGLLERERHMIALERRLAQSARVDDLTGLLNRRGFEAAVAGTTPEFTGTALLILDIDHFKRINDACGHGTGDAVLRELGLRIAAALDGRGLAGRIGGEEFAVFLPSALPREAAAVAHRLWREVRGRPFAAGDGGALAVTASLGGAWGPACTPLGALLASADAALYAAKRAGRDRAHLGPCAAGPGAGGAPGPGFAVEFGDGHDGLSEAALLAMEGSGTAGGARRSPRGGAGRAAA